MINNTRVFPARLRASRPGKREEIEILVLRELAPGDWLTLVKPARKAQLGEELLVGGLRARVLEVKESGSRVFRFESDGNLAQRFEQMGEPPIPPYIHPRKGQDLSEDKQRYQTAQCPSQRFCSSPYSRASLYRRGFSPPSRSRHCRVRSSVARRLRNLSAGSLRKHPGAFHGTGVLRG